MKPKVTVVIPFYNCAYVNIAIESVLNQSYSPIEIIVVDDGSTRNQLLIQPYLPYIHYLGKGNGGTASALNYGIKFSSGQYIAWLSSDDLFYRDKIDHQVSFMIEQHAHISHTNFNYLNAQGHITQYNVAPNYASTAQLYAIFLNANPINGCTVMFTRDMFNRIGLFNEALKYTQDLDFWYRVLLAGYHMPFLNEPLTGYRWHDEMGTRVHNTEVLTELNFLQQNNREALLRMISKQK